MKKRLAILLFIIPAFLVFHSCLDYSLPEQLAVEVEGSLDLPVNIKTSSWGSSLAKVFKKMFSGDEEDTTGGDATDKDNGIKVEVYDVNYGQSAQAFFVSIPIPISNSLNPKDYLKQIEKYLSWGTDDDETWEINVPPVEIPSFKFELGTTSSIPSGESGPIPITDISFRLEDEGISDDFLHAKINKGSLTISLSAEGAPQPELKKYEITIEQDADDTYLGFSASDKKITQDDPSLEGKEINGSKPINISGNIWVTNPGPSLEGKLTITMKIDEFKVLHWKMVSRPLPPNPLSLSEAAGVLKNITFKKCDNDIRSGVGININFKDSSEKIINGLAMTVKCDALGINHVAVPLQIENNVFGNGHEQQLNLGNNPGEYSSLDFEIILLPSYTEHPDVIEISDVKPGETLNIKGDAELFQNWDSAVVDIDAALNATRGDAIPGKENFFFEGKFPNTAEGEDPINLSLFDEYLNLKNFSFKRIEAAAYLSGPNDAIETFSPKLTIMAQYETDSPPDPIFNNYDIKLEKKSLNIEKYLDNNKRSYSKEHLPDDLPGLMSFQFMKILNDRPDDLVFQYKIDLPPTITVYSYMFADDNKSVDNSILATIMLLMHLELTAGPGGGEISYPEMFSDEPRDLFGRGSLDEDSMFTSLNVGYIGFSIDFASAFFTNGSLFIEKEAIDKDGYHFDPVLFPTGIPLNGRRINVNITNDHFAAIRKYYIIPDFKLVFDEGGTITIPRNIGVTSIKIEGKGKSSLNLDF